jgi:hypothetical protein
MAPTILERGLPIRLGCTVKIVYITTGEHTKNMQLRFESIRSNNITVVSMCDKHSCKTSNFNNKKLDDMNYE